MGVTCKHIKWLTSWNIAAIQLQRKVGFIVLSRRETKSGYTILPNLTLKLYSIVVVTVHLIVFIMNATPSIPINRAWNFGCEVQGTLWLNNFGPFCPFVHVHAWAKFYGFFQKKFHALFHGTDYGGSRPEVIVAPVSYYWSGCMWLRACMQNQ